MTHTLSWDNPHCIVTKRIIMDRYERWQQDVYDEAEQPIPQY